MKTMCIHEFLVQEPSIDDVRPHNTMRFDVSIAHFYEMEMDDPTLKDRLAKAITAAIIKTTDKVLEWRHECSEPIKNEFLHYQKVCYDVS